jgi:hypothetical protein
MRNAKCTVVHTTNSVREGRVFSPARARLYRQRQVRLTTRGSHGDPTAAINNVVSVASKGRGPPLRDLEVHNDGYDVHGSNPNNVNDSLWNLFFFSSRHVVASHGHENLCYSKGLFVSCRLC